MSLLSVIRSCTGAWRIKRGQTRWADRTGTQAWPLVSSNEPAPCDAGSFVGGILRATNTEDCDRGLNACGRVGRA